MMMKLPLNWVETKLGTIAEWASGGTPSRKIKAFYEGDIPWIKTGDLNDETVKNVKEYLSEEGIKNSSAKIFPKGSVVVAMYGATIGKTGILGMDASTNQACAVGIPNGGISSKFLHYFLKSQRNEFVNKGKGGAQPNISQTVIKSHLINLPPLPEQNRIVDKLDKLFRQLEVINLRIENLKEIKEKFIYSCLVNTQTRQFFSRQKIGGFLEEGKERIGKNWPQYRKIGVSAKKGIIDLSTGQKKSFETYKVVKPGDFIYNTMRVNIGSIAIYTGKEIAITSPDYVVFRVKDFLSSELLLGFLKSDQGQLEIGANTKGSVRARLYFKSLSEIRMPVSDHKTQILAEKFLTTYSHSLRKLKKISKTKLIDLEKSILNKAFKGELVLQLESDGDARELLEEINNSTDNLVKRASARKQSLKKFNEKFSQKYPEEQSSKNAAAESSSNYSKKK